MLDLLSRRPSLRLLLKALSKKEIHVPAYTKADGTWVPAHTKLVNYNPDHHAVLGGKSSHSHKEALKQLTKDPKFHELPVEHKSHIVQAHAQDIQTAASKAAQVSVFKKELLAGQKPKPSNLAAFNELKETDPAKAAAILDAAKAALGDEKVQELLGPAGAAPEAIKDVPKGPTADELATASAKLQEIAANSPGMSVGFAAYKKLEKDQVWVSKNAVDRLQAVVDLWKELQDAASASAKISTLTKKLAAGKVPSPSELAAYQALDDNGKLKAAQAAIKKSGGKQTFGSLAELMKQAEAKAGITVDKPEVVSLKPTAHFGELFEGETLGIPGKQAKFKYEGGKWNYWTGDSWNEVKAAEWLASLNEGKDVLSKQLLKVVPDPGSNFGQKNEGVEFDIPSAPYTVKFEGGEWLFKYKDTKGGQQGEWHQIANDSMVAALNAGMQYGSNGISKEELVPLVPQVDDSQWGFNESDPGMSGNPTLTASGPNGEQVYIVGTDPADGGPPYSVGIWSDPEDEPEFKEYHTAERVQAALQAKGIHPPEVATIEKVAAAANAPIGPHEGDTKQGVGGVLTLVDGHWTLNNAEVLSFFSKHAIKPGSATAIATTMFLSHAAQGKGASDVMAQLVSVKTAAKNDGYVPAMVNDLIDDLNGIYSKVLDSQLEQQTEAPGTEDAAAPLSYKHTLHNTTEGHNKFWTVEVDPAKATATTTWGKIGAKKPQSKTYKHASAKAAYDAAVDAASAKLGKGYKTVEKVDGQLASAMAAATSFGKENEGKVFSSVLSTGANGFYKYEGGSWHFTFDPKDGWDPIPQQSQLHDNLENGVAQNKAPLLDLGKPSFGAMHPGKMFEATLSTGKKVVFKFEDGQWHNQKLDENGQQTWVPNVSSHWKQVLDEGQDINGNPLVEVASFGIGSLSFGQAHEGQLFTDGETDYKFEDGKWHGIVHGFGDWFEIDPGTMLAGKLDGGTNAKGVELQSKSGAPGVPTAADGPQEGDIKPGKTGWLILKDGHWVKASLEEAIVKLCPVPESITSSALKNTLAELAKTVKVGSPIQKKWKKVATTKSGMPNVNLTIASFGAFGNFGGKWVGYAKKTDLGKAGKWEKVIGTAGHNVAQALNWLEHAAKVQDAFLLKKPVAPESPFAGEVAAPPAAPKGQPTVKPTVPGIPSIDGWKKIGGQGGFNEGGTYTDPDGDEWYCKFPAGGAKVARNELLANKLYDAAGVPVPEVKLVSQGGKIGIASRIVKGAVQDKDMLQSGKGEGLLAGFVADAWLANWDVVGNNPQAGKGWDNIMFLNGKAVRIDPGGALLYGGAGGKKTAFGSEVIELDTMRDPKVNARTAKVFGKISQADLQASAQKVLSIPDSMIQQLVQDHGPGDDAEKAALAKTLLARKAHIESKFPKVAAKVKAAELDDQGDPQPKSKKKKLDPRALPVKPSDLPEPHDFMNWQGAGKAISDKPYVAQNIADEKAIFDFALKGDLVALKKYKFQPVDKMTGAPIGEPQPMAAHPSAHVKSYYDSVVTFLDVIANPPEPLKAFSGKSADTIESLSKAFKPFNYGHSVASVPPNQRLGFWIALGTVANPAHFQPVAVFKSITAAAKAAAYNKWNMLPTMVRKFLSSVQSSGSANQPYRDGKMTDHQGQDCRKVLTNLYEHASEHQEGFTIYKWINMPEAMVKAILGQPEGLVFQNPGSMCCSRSAEGTKGFGNHRMIIHYAKGAKAMDTFGSGKFNGEQEVTTLPGARFMVLSRKMVSGKGGYGGAGNQRLELEVLMLPPDQTYVDNLKAPVS